LYFYSQPIQVIDCLIIKYHNPMRCLGLLLLFFSISFSLAAQKDQFNLNDFSLSGSTKQTGDRCFQLTSDFVWDYGSIWSKQAISLNDPFEMELELFFGCNDLQGADGMVFIFHPYRGQRGRAGEGMGFRGIYPALGIELDTYYNRHLGDPTYDHIALMKNGSVRHYSALTEPVSAKANKGNIEDCKNHLVKVTWEPKSKSLKIFFDGEERIHYQKDIVKNVFENSPMVYWGFSAATGGKSNKHAVCMKKLIYTKVDAYDRTAIKKIKGGENYVLDGVDFSSGKSALLRSSYKELDKLYYFLKTNPKANIAITGHTDSVGSDTGNAAISKRRAEAVSDYLAKRGISRKRLKTIGYGEKFPIAPNTTAAGRKQNRRVSIYVVKPQV